LAPGSGKITTAMPRAAAGEQKKKTQNRGLRRPTRRAKDLFRNRGDGLDNVALKADICR